jgi:trk system potassium uptake protein TrkH
VALLLLIPAGVAWLYEDASEKNELRAFLISSAASLVIGLVLFCLNRGQFKNVGNQEGLAAVSISWLVLSLFAALPMTLWEGTINGREIGITDSYFEAMSGLTTTGATIIENIPELPHGLLFWRSFTHWLGGMGIVVLWVAILPAFGPGSYQLFRSEMPGLSAERITPRIGETAKILWSIYCLLTIVEVLLLWAHKDINLFSALCHTFGTMATGGFSIHNASIAHYNSWYVDTVIIAFMFLAGCNFGLYYLLFTKRYDEVFQNTEIRFYVTVLLISVIVITISVRTQGLRKPGVEGMSKEAIAAEHEKFKGEEYKVRSVPETLRAVTFQVVAVTTTTGYATADFDRWPDLARTLLVVLMFFGGCAGSTGGGLKQIRIILLIKFAFRELRKAIQPSAVFPIKVGGRAIDESVLSSVIGLFSMAAILLVVVTLIISALGVDIVTSFTAVIATMFNIGPGLAKVGAAQNYAFMPDAAKWVLSGTMLLGRLEFVCVLVLFQPLLYRK